MTTARSARARSLAGRARPARGERGQVLLLVAMLGLLAMAVWLMGWRATHDAIRGERFHVLRDQRRATVHTALARGVALLRTGRPPSDPYEAIVTLSWDGDDHDCAVVFTSQVDQDHWEVVARFATEGEVATYPTLPASF